VLIGDDEVRSGTLTVKALREDRPQQSMTLDELVELLTVMQSGGTGVGLSQ
jgi:histidyl-tRNA synthetase